ncbi:hypothetical protein [Amnibacterium kyonggiense]|uniref:Uncharacterized protein n=1 Tax=Amnibacterium kyonggiense TaxID=595671 RepID=A0A4R7FIG8_9MICO|nr:hypothetical protein [Amnibacterium kyonggiense]TDS75921.1 hypothetical protein CLV52_3032 [Amnibacterium kyonggiense]
MRHYRSRITKRLRQTEQLLPVEERAENGGEWESISEADAVADVRYIRNRGGAVHSIGTADLAAALAAGGEEITAADAQAESPKLFGGQAAVASSPAVGA